MFLVCRPYLKADLLGYTPRHFESSEKIAPRTAKIQVIFLTNFIKSPLKRVILSIGEWPSCNHHYNSSCNNLLFISNVHAGYGRKCRSDFCKCYQEKVYPIFETRSSHWRHWPFWLVVNFRRDISKLEYPWQGLETERSWRSNDVKYKREYLNQFYLLNRFWKWNNSICFGSNFLLYFQVNGK